MAPDDEHTIEHELARWREWPGPRDEPEGAGEPWARDDEPEHGRHARKDRDDS
jgi:hypothetical protein